MNLPHTNPTRLRLAEIRAAVEPLPVRFFATVGSTNRWAADALRRRALAPPAVVLAARQSAGVGRRGSKWWSPTGNLALTLVLPPPESRPGRGLPAHELAIRAAVAVRSAIAGLIDAHGDAVAIKWPNDLVVHPNAGRLAGRKLAGLLCERLDGGDLIGVGVNVNDDRAPASVQRDGTIASLARLAGRPVDLTTAAARIALAVRNAFLPHHAPPFPHVLKTYQAWDALAHRGVHVRLPDALMLTGIAEGVDPLGRLKVRCGKDLRLVHSGHVSRWRTRD